MGDTITLEIVDDAFTQITGLTNLKQYALQNVTEIECYIQQETDEPAATTRGKIINPFASALLDKESGSDFWLRSRKGAGEVVFNELV